MDRILPKNAYLIPDSAKCVFKGQIFDVYQWPQKLFDGSEATFEMLKRPDTVVVIAIDGEKVIYIQDEQPPNRTRIGLPGGRVDEGESWLEAAKRETVKEIGFSFNNWKLVDVIQPVSKTEWFVATFIAWDVASKIKAEPGPGEKIDVRYDSLENVIDIINNSGYGFLPKVVKDVKIIQELISLEEYHG